MWFVYSVFRYWKFGIIMGLVIALMYSMLMINKKDRLIAEQEHFINEKVFYLESLEDAVVIQNEMIEQQRAVEEMWEELTEESQQKVKIVRATERQKVLNLIKANSGNTCTETMDWMVDQVEGELKW